LFFSPRVGHRRKKDGKLKTEQIAPALVVFLW